MLLLALCCLLSGHVATPSGVPIANADVELRGAAPVHAKTNVSGAFLIHVGKGVYHVYADAAGYSPATAGPIAVDGDTRLDVTLEPLDAPQLRVISSVRVNGSLAIQRDAVPTVNVSRKDMSALGASRIVDVLAAIPSVTFARPDAGNAAAPSLVALRGPDPSETLIALDGEILNDANTGDLDLSRFPVAAFSNVDVTEGLGPADSEGSNTIGGAVNIISLQPTRDQHSAFSFSTGSFGTSEGWYNTTGTKGRLGYALALDDQQQHGYVDQTVDWQGQPLHLGSTISSRALLAKATWAFSQQADIGLRVFSLGNTRDMSAALNTPVDPSQDGEGALFDGPGPATFQQAVRAYALNGRAPLGAGSLIYNLSASNNDVNYTGGAVTPYDLTHRDKRNTLSLSWQHDTDTTEFAVGGYVRGESLTADGIDGELTQSIRSYFIRGMVRASRKLRVQGGIYASNYSTFGSNVDGRIAANYDLDASSVLRASAGTGFRAPLLIERYVFPVADLPLDQNCVAVGQGNTDEKPEHATEYELGYGHRFGSTANVDVSLYRTNLRDPIEVFYPLGSTCPATNPPAQSYPINVGNAVYQGAEIRFAQRVGPHIVMHAAYGLNVAYPDNMPPSVANPTSGGDLVAGQQFLGIPQQQGSFDLNWENADWHAGLQAWARGKNNELNQASFAVVDAAIGRRFGDMDLTLAGTNLTSAVSGKFTLPGLGVPYNGIGGPLATDRYVLEPAGIRVIATFKT
jgi:outer membrane cobalamin receptor